MNREEFVDKYGGVYEHSPWVAEQAYDSANASDERGLAMLFAECVDRADAKTKLTLIRAHPDLAGKAAVAGELTQDSSEEQQSAGIDQCTTDEYENFQAMNEQYKDKFGFPFVMAVRNSDRHKILAAFAERLQNDQVTEADKAIQEIHKIARLRLKVMAIDQGTISNDE